MSREKDVRDFGASRATPDRRALLTAAASEASRRLPGTHEVRVASFDATTGNPARLRSEGDAPQAGRFVQRALQHVQAVAPALGLKADSQAAEFVADPTVQETSSGATTVHLQQQYKGIAVFQSAVAVRFAPQGELVDTVGTTMTIGADVPVAPALTASDAVLAAARYLAQAAPDDDTGEADQFGEPLAPATVDISDFEPKVRAVFATTPQQATVLERGPFGDEITASLLWFAVGEQLELGWDVALAMPGAGERYEVIVDAAAGEILYAHQLVRHVARGNVYRTDPRTPRELTSFPRPVGDYGLPLPPLPPGFPDAWVAAKSAQGNSTRAHLSAAGQTLDAVVRDGVVTFDPADATGDDQKILNIFYLCCYMHDFAYLLGFREADANFQTDNLGRGGRPGDPVDARSWPAAVQGTANMSTPADGSSPVMNMGMVTSTNRHTAFDSTVVFHEFTHGITTRLVGGGLSPGALSSIQSAGMGEGWSDYIACTINDVVVVGDWVVDDPTGIRGFPYDEKFPDGFGKLGTGRYSEVHNIGEIWCATLMALNRRIGKLFALQLVIDALKLSAPNPSFLNMRDHILAALENLLLAGGIDAHQRDGAWQAMWGIFAHFGMGPQAASNGAQLAGIVGDETVGQANWRRCGKCQGLFFAGNPGSRCPAGAAHDATGSADYDIVQDWPAAPGQPNWRACTQCQGLYFAGDPGTAGQLDSVCPAGAAHEDAGSGDHKLIVDAVGSSGETDWRACQKCNGLYFAGNPGSVCPDGAEHESTGSGDYSLLARQ